MILLYSVYQVKVNDSQWWGYTFMGVSLWTVGAILVASSDKTPKWYKVDKLLSYPLLSLIIFIVALHASGLFDFLFKAILLSGIGEVLVYVLQKKFSKSIILAYYSTLVILSWILLYTYPLVALSYSLFTIYGAMNLLQLTNRHKGSVVNDYK
ncbi:hypothetical protein [Thermococcus henrietii]|uniref:hypothetical protein n=1 Tax=Thermococcus henrietii TaxID=2016361 RepID=UPI0011AB368A|nr:hypothetical protein [Thermococcus henrietii]